MVRTADLMSGVSWCKVCNEGELTQWRGGARLEDRHREISLGSCLKLCIFY